MPKNKDIVAKNMIFLISKLSILWSRGINKGMDIGNSTGNDIHFERDDIELLRLDLEKT